MKSSESHFSVKLLQEKLTRLPSPSKYWVGFSGGADSTALLQALYECREQLSAPVHAIHFHHGLQEAASAWQEHCESFCEDRDIPFQSEKLEINLEGRSSLEEESRNCRYRAVARILGDQEMYLTAHHAEDQAETLFLNLMRGSGIEGLAGIPVLRNLENGWVARPLLDCNSRATPAARMAVNPAHRSRLAFGAIASGLLIRFSNVSEGIIESERTWQAYGTGKEDFLSNCKDHLTFL